MFASALLVGLAGNALSRARRRPALVLVVPGILMLVPGGIGYESASSLLADDTVQGIAAAMDALVVALSIVYGLIVSTVMLPERRRHAI